MSELVFGRAYSFRATHHYWIATWSEAENQARFGPASLPHEHLWTLTVWLAGPLDPQTGMVVDLVLVDQVLAEVASRFEGRHFREVDPYFIEHQPTTEVLAQYFAEKMRYRFGTARLARLRIAEMDSLFAEWHS